MELATLRVYDQDVPAIRFYLTGSQSPLYAVSNDIFDQVIDEAGYPINEEARLFDDQVECYLPIEEGTTLTGLFLNQGADAIKELIVEVTQISAELLQI